MTEAKSASVSKRGYRRLGVVALLLVLAGAIIVDHTNSLTFRSNMGEGGFETTLTQRDSRVGACAPCGAPCPSSRRSAE